MTEPTLIALGDYDDFLDLRPLPVPPGLELPDPELQRQVDEWDHNYERERIMWSFRMRWATKRVFTTGTSADRCARCSEPFAMMDRRKGKPRMLVVKTFVHGWLCIVCAYDDPDCMYTASEMRAIFGPRWRRGGPPSPWYRQYRF